MSRPNNDPDDANKLGEGSFGCVRRDGDVAVKSFARSRHYVREYLIGSLLDHKNIIKFHEQKRLSCSSINMDLYDMSFKTWLSTHDDESQYCFVITEVLHALNYLHFNEIVHADVKPDNIVLKVNKATGKILKVVLCDLGISNIRKYSLPQLTSPLFKDPECLNEKCHDIYSVGVMIITLFFRKTGTHYPDGICEEMKKQVMYDSIDTYVAKYKNRVPQKYRVVVRAMLTESRVRPTARECLRMLGCYPERLTRIHKSIVIDDDDINKYIHTYFKVEGRGVHRTKLFAYSVDRYFRRNDIAPPQCKRSKSYIYIRACFFIIDSMCGTTILDRHPADEEDIIIYANKLIKDEEFRREVTTPTELLKKPRAKNE